MILMKNLKRTLLATSLLLAQGAWAANTAVESDKVVKSRVSASALSMQSQSMATMFDVGAFVTKEGSSEMRFSFNGFPLEPKIDKESELNRLTLNFGHVKLELKPEIKHRSTKEIKNYKLERTPDGDLIAQIDLAGASNYASRIIGGEFILTVLPTENKVVAQTALTTRGVLAVNFARTKGGEDQAIFELAGNDTPIDVKQDGSKIVVKFKGSKIPENYLKTRAFNDSRAVIANAKIYNSGNDGVVELTQIGGFDYVAYQVDKKLTLNVAKKNIKAIASENVDQVKYKGKKISMDFQNVEVRRILQLLASYTGVNIVTSDNVTGNISLKVQDVPWDQALNIIMKSKSLASRTDGNVIWVAPIDELVRFENAEAKAYAQSISLAPLKTAFITLNYANAKDIGALIDSSTSAQEEKDARAGGEIANRQFNINQMNLNGDGTSALLSPRGSAIVDTRTNTIIVNDTAAKIQELKKILAQLDVPVRQVMVEAKIVRATASFSKAVGVKWGFLSSGGISTASDLTNLHNTSKYMTSKGEGEIPENNVNIDLGQTTGTSGIALGIINTTDALLGLEISALQSDGLGEVLSTPRVMTGDKQEAKIRSGVKLPYKTVSDGGTNTEFQEAMIELTVTPSITPEGTVQMKLEISKDAQGALTDAGYAIDTNQLSTNVIVGDGETVVLGGLYEDNKTDDLEKVPFLGDLPVVGKMFTSKVKTQSKRELLIFITPRIMNEASVKK